MNKRKQQLLDTALMLFDKNGVANTTIQMILDHSGVSKGTFYKFFSSKDDCILAILEQRIQEDMMIRQDLEMQGYASEFDLLVDQIVVPMISPDKQRVVELFWTGFYSGEFDVEHLTRIQLNWLSGRLVQLFGEEVKPYACEGAIFCFGMVHQISNTWRNFHLNQPNWKSLVPKVLNYIEVLLRAMVNKQEHIIDAASLAVIDPGIKRTVPDKTYLLAELEKFNHSVQNSQGSIQAKELSQGLWSLFREDTLNMSMLKITLSAFQAAFVSGHAQLQANKIAQACWWFIELNGPIENGEQQMEM
ncbi:TetR/AcrR family transcriptional regulator [Paenibacillus sp. MABNR03]|uniref:TetR/AcrR family transcriptional regulator n=1 Tax=Paenibacillus sp. MABNR03 TaxID=3142626 RepID=UPI003D299AC9